VFDSIADSVSGSPWTYVLIAAVCAGDAVFPLLPSETIVIAAAVLATRGGLDIVLVVMSAAAGALAGDNAAYGIGRSGLRRIAARFMESEKSRRRLDWAHDQLEDHGVWIIVVARFIPGGRTATTYVAGTVAMPWKRRFLPADAVAAVLWALYASGLGYLGGAAFKDNLWLPLLIGAGAGLVIGGIGELLRRRLRAGPPSSRRGTPASRTSPSETAASGPPASGSRRRERGSRPGT
jgi:membrane protein DedA with SNARE-associated domain